MQTHSMPPGVNGYELFIIGITSLALFNLVLLVLPVASEVKDVVRLIDFPISLILLLDFAGRLARAPHRRRYLTRELGWLDLLGSFPPPPLKLLRIPRLVRSVNVFRRAGGRATVRQVIRDRASSTLLATFLLVIVVLEFAGSIMVSVEADSPTANIQTASDGLWWAYVTITTVGYGDRYPTTGQGRIVGVILMSVGVALFGVFTSYLSREFLKTGNADNQRLDELAADVAEIKRLLQAGARPQPTAEDDAPDSGQRPRER
jgi:voltage-gated potassium channel